MGYNVHRDTVSLRYQILEEKYYDNYDLSRFPRANSM